MVIAASMQSCEGPAGPEGPIGPQGASYYYINKSFTVDSNDWYDNGSCYIYTFKIPELTANICETASINAYFFDDEDYQYQLPYEQFFWEDDGDQKDPVTGEIYTNKIYYSRLIRYDFTQGEITFVVNYSDFAEDRPETMDFRLVVHY